MSRISHFEIPSDHPEKSMSFYNHVFGWTFQKFGEYEYWIATTGDSSPSAAELEVVQL
ncbi:MAG: VOC family protein, partial [Bacteroidota bacterium]